VAEIKTTRLSLCTVTPEHATRIAELTSDIDVSRMTARIPHPNRAEGVLFWMAGLEASGERAFATLHDGELIGVCSYSTALDPAPGELGYWVGKPYWDRGFATEMAQAVIRHVFTTTDRRVIPISHFADNPGSARVIAKCGFVPTGSRRMFSLARGHEVDALTYRLTHAEAKAQAWWRTS
jgi:[ribosomal protein S5]-alanine N-acetyltransferase